jgi:hypothetical protein
MLYVPDHVAKEEKEKQTSLSDAYVNKEEKVLNPELIDKKLTERLPHAIPRSCKKRWGYCYPRCC